MWTREESLWVPSSSLAKKTLHSGSPTNEKKEPDGSLSVRGFAPYRGRKSFPAPLLGRGYPAPSPTRLLLLRAFRLWRLFSRQSLNEKVINFHSVRTETQFLYADLQTQFIQRRVKYYLIWGGFFFNIHAVVVEMTLVLLFVVQCHFQTQRPVIPAQISSPVRCNYLLTTSDNCSLTYVQMSYASKTVGIWIDWVFRFSLKPRTSPTEPVILLLPGFRESEQT